MCFFNINSEIPHETVRSVVVPFINEYFSVNCLADYENRYIKLDQNHGNVAIHVEAILVTCHSNQFPIDVDNTTFFVYKLNRPDPELEMIEVISMFSYLSSIQLFRF